MFIDTHEFMPDLESEAILIKAKPFDPPTHLEDFTRRFLTAMQILRIGRVHPTEVIKIIYLPAFIHSFLYLTLFSKEILP